MHGLPSLIAVVTSCLALGLVLAWSGVLRIDGAGARAGALPSTTVPSALLARLA